MQDESQDQCKWLCCDGAGEGPRLKILVLRMKFSVPVPGFLCSNLIFSCIGAGFIIALEKTRALAAS